MNIKALAITAVTVIVALIVYDKWIKGRLA